MHIRDPRWVPSPARPSRCGRVLGIRVAALRQRGAGDRRRGLTWFNPDTFARQLVAVSGCDQATANGHAWTEGLRRLDEAVAGGYSHAFETTLAGRTMANCIAEAARTHDVLIWFCGLASPDQHVSRVRARVAAGGHDIPEARIRERSPRALRNVIALMPAVTRLQVYDNSTDAASGRPIPDPTPVLQMHDGRLTWPAPEDTVALTRTPDWAKPLLEAALTLSAG